VNRKEATEAFCRELKSLARTTAGVDWLGKFESTSKRDITFLDTKDQTIQLNRLLLRKRVDLEVEETQFTLKCRSPDRYVAAGSATSARNGQGKPKFEEDIGSPFVVRFSSSCTVTGVEKSLKSLGDAAKLFPVLGQLERDGEKCPKSLALSSVNAATIYERVLTGPMLKLEGQSAEVAIILWSDGVDGRPLVAEFSFRYKAKDEQFSPATAKVAMDFYQLLQRLDWCLEGARTKTQFAYGES
jgi:hypothetical protein